MFHVAGVGRANDGNFPIELASSTLPTQEIRNTYFETMEMLLHICIIVYLLFVSLSISSYCTGVDFDVDNNYRYVEYHVQCICSYRTEK